MPEHTNHNESAFTLAELVVAVALSGIIVLLCTKVYLIFTPQFRKGIQVSESNYNRMLKVSSLEKMLRANVYGEATPVGQANYIHAKEWVQKLRRFSRAPDSLAISWRLNQYSMDSLYTIQDRELRRHYDDLSEYAQDHLYLSAVTLELSERDKPNTEVYSLFGDSPNLSRIKVKELF